MFLTEIKQGLLFKRNNKVGDLTLYRPLADTKGTACGFIRVELPARDHSWKR